jgi:GTP-binding nuclear protein Ran
MQTYTINFLGEGGVGKTTWIHKMKTESFEKKYMATVGMEAHPFSVDTNHGTILLNIWDYAGQEKYGGGLPTKPCDATILMFDLSSTHSYTQLSFWHQKCAMEPVFVVGNKSDIAGRKVQNPTFHEEHNLTYLELSTKTMTTKDLLTPILRRLTGHEDLVIQEPSGIPE